jgi:hypothetical protein
MTRIKAIPWRTGHYRCLPCLIRGSDLGNPRRDRAAPRPRCRRSAGRRRLLVLAALAALVAYDDREEAVMLLVAVWALVSPWVLHYPHAAAMKVHVGVGLIVAYLAALELWLMHHEGSTDYSAARERASRPNCDRSAIAALRPRTAVEACFVLLFALRPRVTRGGNEIAHLTPSPGIGVKQPCPYNRSSEPVRHKETSP